MDFGDILKKWERGTGASQSKDIDLWLQKNKVPDKDAVAGRTPVRGKNRQRLLRIEPDGVLDIHGLTSEKAWISLEHFFSNAKENGFEKLRIVHGKGNHSNGDAVLTGVVRKYIEKCPFAGESGSEKAINGGSGATWVFLKPNKDL